MTEKYISADKLFTDLFSEESDSFYDSYEDAQDRRRGKNPMSLEYQEKVNTKRKTLEVSLLDASGMPIDNSSMQRCIEEIEALMKGTKTKYTDLINNILTEIKREKGELEESIKDTSKKTSELRNTINVRDPSTWTETMINNSYALMEASDRWEMERTMPFEEFKAKLFSDPDFAASNAPRAGMESEDYNPWAT